MSLNVMILIFDLRYKDSYMSYLVKVQQFLTKYTDKLSIKNYGYQITFVKYSSTILAFKQIRKVNNNPQFFEFVKAYLFTPKYLKEMSFEFIECRKKVLKFIDDSLQLQKFLLNSQQDETLEDLHEQNHFILKTAQTMIIDGINPQIYTPLMVYNIVRQFGKVNDLILQTVYPFQWYVQYDDINNLLLAVKSLDKINLFGAEIEVLPVQHKNCKNMFLSKNTHLKFVKNTFDLAFANQPTKFLNLTTFKKGIKTKDIQILLDPFFRPKKIVQLSQNELTTFAIVMKSKEQAVELVSIYDHVKLGKNYLHFFFTDNVSFKQNFLINL